MREDTARVVRLVEALNDYGIRTWVDRMDLEPGQAWPQAIREAILSGMAFVACFSRHYQTRPASYMQEELALAVKALGMSRHDGSALFAVRLSGDVPSVDLGPNARWIDWRRSRQDGIRRLIEEIHSLKPANARAIEGLGKMLLCGRRTSDRVRAGERIMAFAQHPAAVEVLAKAVREKSHAVVALAAGSLRMAGPQGLPIVQAAFRSCRNVGIRETLAYQRSLWPPSTSRTGLFRQRARPGGDSKEEARPPAAGPSSCSPDDQPRHTDPDRYTAIPRRPASPTAQVCLLHAAEDSSDVARLATALKRHGIAAHRFSTAATSAEAPARYIVRQEGRVVLCLSPNLGAEDVRQLHGFLDRAAMRGVRRFDQLVIPVVLRGTIPDDRFLEDAGLASRHVVDLVRDWDMGVAMVATAVLGASMHEVMIIRDLAVKLASGDERVRFAAGFDLYRYAGHPITLAEIAEAWCRPCSVMLRSVLAGVACRAGARGLPLLAKMLACSSDFEAYAALTCHLGASRRSSAEIVNQLRSDLKRRNPLIRELAAETLAKVTPTPRAAHSSTNTNQELCQRHVS